MFIGHYGLSYIVKKNETEIPLWLLFTSVQLLDLIAFTLVLFGIENAAYSPNENPFFRNNLYLPYSHSLIGAIIISMAIFLFFWTKNKKSWAWILGLSVLSHWFIDFIVHTNDLSIFFGSYTIGLGLWNYPYLSYSIEIFFVLIGWVILKKQNVFSYIILILMIASFSGMVFSEEPGLMKQYSALRTSVVLITNGIFIFLAYLADGKSNRLNLLSKVDGFK